jgi:hypothetical protein
VAVIVKLNAPAAVGVPLITPEVGWTDKPVGRPEALKVAAGEPSADTVAEYALPSVIVPNTPDTAVGAVAGSRTLPAKVADAEPKLFVAVIVNV